jgi:hypothetical protein
MSRSPLSFDLAPGSDVSCAGVQWTVVLPRTSRRGEPQPERLRQHLPRPAREVQRQQQLMLGQALKPVLPSRGHHIGQPRAMPLAGTPRESPYRNRQGRRHGSQVTHRADHIARGRFPRRCPSTWPVPTELQLRYHRPRKLVRRQQVIQPARVRPHRAGTSSARPSAETTRPAHRTTRKPHGGHAHYSHTDHPYRAAFCGQQREKLSRPVDEDLLGGSTFAPWPGRSPGERGVSGSAHRAVVVALRSSSLRGDSGFHRGTSRMRGPQPIAGI